MSIHDGLLAASIEHPDDAPRPIYADFDATPARRLVIGVSRIIPRRKERIPNP